MSRVASSNLRYNVDHLAVNSNALFAWGWMFDTRAPLLDIRLRLTLSDGRIVDQPLRHGAFRADVRDVFPHTETASASGFIVSAAWRGALLRHADLLAIDSDGMAHQVTIWRTPAASRAWKGARIGHALLSLGSLSRKAMGLARRGQFMVLKEKARRYLANRPTRVADPIEHLRHALRASGGAPAWLVVDHDLGGGAPQYRRQLIERHVKAGGTALLLTFHVPTLRYALQVYGATPSVRVALSRLEALRGLAREGLLGDIFFNNAVSFSEPEQIPGMLVDLHAITRGKLTLAAHDYQMLCPSHFLLDAEGGFCGLPAETVCRQCLANTTEGFVSFYPARDIVRWRQAWRHLIDDADSILFFSQSTLELYRRVFPDLLLLKASVQPHRMDYFPARSHCATPGGALHLGVAGNLGRHKGAGIVARLARYVDEHGLDVRITVFGLIEEPVPASVVRVTGAYTHDELPELIRSSGVNLLFVPSIFPETFSYVTHELMLTDMPVVAFDLGAQAEALRSYVRGRVIAFAEGEALLGALLAVHAQFIT